MTEATTSDYWISSNALYIELNAIGNPDYIQASCVSDAKILVYVKDIIGYDAGHNYRRWSLQSAPTIFNSHTAKYVYFAIPKSDKSDAPALVVYPSEKVDIYGKNEAGVQIGSADYYYVFSQGIISDSGTSGTVQRVWTSVVQTGILSSDEAISAMGGDGTWWKYSSVDDMVTFLKDIWNATFHYLKVQKELIFNGHTLVGVAGDNTDVTDDQTIVTPAWGEDHWLSSKDDDTANGTITFKEGLKIGNGAGEWKKDGSITAYDIDANDIVANALTSQDFDNATESGYGFYKRKDGKWGLYVTDLSVWGKAVFNQLTIRKLNAVDGNLVFSPAASKISYVKPAYVNGDKVTDVASIDEGNGWKCYLLADDGTMATTNSWAKYDQARCQTFNVAEGTYENVANKYYWRMVTAVSTSEQNEVITDEDGNELFGGQKFAWIVLDKDDCDTNSDEPAAGDSIVLEGNRVDTDRQNLVIKETWGDEAPREVAYVGVHSYSLTGHVTYEIGPKKVRFYTQYYELVTGSGNPVYQVSYRGHYEPDEKYSYYEEVTYNGTRWLCIVPEGQLATEPPSADSSQWMATTTILEPALVIVHDLNAGIALGETHTVKAVAYMGDEDITGKVTAWSVVRDSGDAAEDGVWAAQSKVKNFNGSIDISWTEDCDDLGKSTYGHTLFTFTAALADGELLSTTLNVLA